MAEVGVAMAIMKLQEVAALRTDEWGCHDSVLQLKDTLRNCHLSDKIIELHFSLAFLYSLWPKPDCISS